MSKIEAKAKIEFTPTKEQELAINHVGSDLLISAGAGSGKTATLTDRIVNRICQGSDISRILVVTFTNDAANELKTRIAKKLAEKLCLDPNNHHLSSQIVKVTSADISTIHSFCLKCLRPYFDKLQLDSDFRIGEENELNVIRLEAMNEVIDSFYEADEENEDFLLVSDCYSEYTNEEALPTSLLDLYNKLNSSAKGIDVLLDTVDKDVDFLQTKYGQVLLRKISRIVKRFLPITKELFAEIASNADNKKYFELFEEYVNILERLENALSNPSYMLIKGIFEDYVGKRLPGGRSKAQPSVDEEFVKYIREDLTKELKSLKENYFYTDDKTIASTIEQNERICKAIYNILAIYDKEYKAKKRKYSLCDFNDLERYTLKLFYNDDGTYSSIAREVSLKYDELYIDEYQDVNSIQDSIFKAISRNNRFMVGDIKQSIYGFRAAEPELFSNYRDSFTEYDLSSGDEGKTIFMSDNFRCDPSVIKMANHLSDHMFLNTKGFTYVEGDKLKCSKKLPNDFVGQNAELCIIDSSSIDEESPLNDIDPQAEFVAQEIKRLLDNGYLPNGEKIEPKHIAILLRKSHDKIEKYIDALNRYNIKNEYIQEISFFEKPHILLLLCILNSIDNPSKDVYLAGALHSQIWNFSLEELVKIKKFSPSEYSLFSALKNYGGDKELTKKIEVLLNKLKSYADEIRKLSATETISYVINETGFVSSCNKEERQDVIKLYNMARGYESNSYKGLYSFLRYIDDVASKKGISETVTCDPNNSVKIMTMHKSKGLEYEICFISDTDSAFSRQGYTSPMLYHKDLGICGYISRTDGIVKYDNILRKCATLAIKESELEESLRLLYVAMTRARSKLYITAKLAKQEEKRARHKKLSSYTDEYTLYSYGNHIDIILGACTMPLDFLDVKIITQDDIYELEKEEKSDTCVDKSRVEEIKELLEERFNFKYKYDYLEKIPSKLSISTLYPEILDNDENSEFTFHHSIDSVPKFAIDKKDSVTGADRGTATHVFLQFCDFENLKKHGVECELKRLLDNSFISKGVGEIINKEHIEAFITSQLMSDFLNAKEVIREFRFNVMLNASEFTTDERLNNEKVLVQGVTDCIYENEQGELILVDYKTDKVTEENYISELTRKHKTQLTYYKKACELMFEKPISKVLIYSVPLAKTVEIE
ncbi:MAG: UvrD-helicase domain-containing protein [Clostridia bacterium]|nr:UvrD-helicase domain-containing protein [Clostridia bacterium]